MSKLSVSVVMCTYNGAAFIEQQLLSILSQTYPIKELVIFDDASTDDTVSILRSLITGQRNIRLYVNVRNIGFTKNFEQAVLAATNDAIAIADQDDVWADSKLEKMIKVWKPGVPLIYCDSIRFIGHLPIHPKPNPLLKRFEGTDGRKLFMYNTVSGHAMMFRKQLLQHATPFPSDVAYDWWMALVACYNGGVQYLPETLVFQRSHGSNASMLAENSPDKKQVKAYFKKMVGEACTAFANVPAMPCNHQKLALELASLIKRSFSYRFYLPLFRLMLRHRKMFFNKKKRKIGFPSHVKQSIKNTLN